MKKFTYHKGNMALVFLTKVIYQKLNHPNYLWKDTDLKNDKSNSINNPTIYKKLVGKLIYLNITMLDLSFPVHQLSHFMNSPKEVHLNVLLKLIRYIKNASRHGLLYKKSSSILLHGFCDSQWVACHISRKSQSGFCIIFGSSLNSWKSKK